MNSETGNELSLQQQQELLRVARESIQHGLEHRHAINVDADAYDEQLQHHGGSFVTLNKNGALRGCIGTLQPYQPLLNDVAEHARAAAFSDPRFPPLSVDEFADIVISVSVLGKPSAINFSDEEDLISQLRPLEDGLIFEEGGNRGTFLPSVWESLPEPRQFLQQLKRKAGLPVDYWSDNLKISRYTTQSFSEKA
ncbi:MAG: AmmeMemoRadiSam system protein A [Gammaproteobacteria bacterium]|nr:AmmeMemoRadiSam system protein A [Gammaproteobacteria bacterium]